jgi:DedD protein
VATRYLEDEDIDAPREREISLGASTLLGMFLLLALVCAAFFGFGYTMGRRSSVATVPTTGTVDTAILKTTGGTKPTPGVTPHSASESVDTADQSSAQTADEATQISQPVEAPAAVAERPAQQKPQPATAVKPASFTPLPTPAKAATTQAIAPAAPALVQVAAVSHQEDADILVNSLKHRGYQVAVRHEPQDKLFHIQLGPYATRQDAIAMRQRLLADGYNAIVK